MGWGNGQVEYGPAQIYGGDVIYVEDDQMVNALQKENDKLIRFFEETFISARAWKLVAYTVANSKNKNDRSIDELNALHKKAGAILRKAVKESSFKQFYSNDLSLVMLEP